MHILIKKIDTYKSTNHKNKTISEFILYLMIGETIIEAQTTIGDQQKDLALLNLLQKYANTIINVIEKN